MRKKLGWSVRMSWSNELPPLQFQNSYEEKCFNHFIRIRDHHDCRLRYAICSNDIKVFYYYHDDELFDASKDIKILRQFRIIALEGYLYLCMQCSVRNIF